MDIPAGFRDMSVEQSLRNLVRAAPWAALLALCFLVLFRFLPFADLDPRLKSHYILGDVFFLAWSCLAWWAGRRALRTGRLGMLTLNMAHVLVLAESAYMTVLGNLHGHNLFNVAFALFVLPGVFYMSPRRFRAGVVCMLCAIAVPLYLHIDHRERFPAMVGQALMLAVLSSLLQAHLFRTRLAIHRHMERLEEANEVLARSAAHDHLTGLANRRRFDERFLQEWARSRRHGNVFSLISADLDFFKRINDTRGHAFGDRVLQELGELLQGMVRHTDTAARMGGEEFMLLLVETDRDGALVLARRLLQAVPGIPANSEYGPITASLGLVSSDECEDPDELLHMVDRRLYRAKHEGRDRVIAGE